MGFISSRELASKIQLDRNLMTKETPACYRPRYNGTSGSGRQVARGRLATSLEGSKWLIEIEYSRRSAVMIPRYEGWMELPMAGIGLEVKPGNDMTRIQVVCEHQQGLIYVVPAERSWVCSSANLPAHALAGFFREMVALKDPKVEALMQEWGVYYRQLPKDQDDGVTSE